MSPGVWFHASLVPKKRRGRSALDEQKPCGFGAIASQPRGNHLLLQDVTRNRGKELEEIQEAMEATTTSIFNNVDQTFDLAAFLKTAASSINVATASNNNATNINNNNGIHNSASECASEYASSPAPPNLSSTTQMMNPAFTIPLNNLAPFVPIRPVYAPSGYGRQILIYDSRSNPGCRREFAYKTRFTNQSGLTTVYYRCMACRALRHRLQRVLAKDKLPAVPCIAVKNDMLINDPDFPEASDHFCTPLTIDESNNRLKITFERGFKRARMKMASGGGPEDSPNAKSNGRVSATCEIDESSTNPINIDQYFWTKTSESASCLLAGDETAQSSSSEASNRDTNGAVGSKRCPSNGDAHSTSHDDGEDADMTLDYAAESDAEPPSPVVRDNTSPRKRLDDLLRIQERRLEEKRIKEESEAARDKSTSPDENLNIVQPALPKFLSQVENGQTQASSLMTQLGVGAGLVNGAAANGLNLASINAFLNQSVTNGNGTSGDNMNMFNNMQKLAAHIRGSELLKALNKPTNKGPMMNGGSFPAVSQALYSSTYGNMAAFLNGSNSVNGNHIQGISSCSTFSPHISEILNKYVKNNWDLQENAGNSRSAAELTCTLILSLSRHVPQAAASMKQGKWARKDYMGEEVFGKTLAIIGLGRIGQEVASRMQAFGMKTVGYDPLVSNEEAAKRKIKWLPLEEIWPVADYITVHVPLIPQTKDLLNHATLAQCKKGVRIVNVARGGIINEQDLVESMNTGHVGGAAIDVFVEEPPSYLALVEHPNVICTPHLGASTLEAQQRVAIEIAENIIAVKNGTGLFGALNASALAAVLDETKAQYVKAVSDLGHLLASLASNTKNVTVKHPGGANGMQKALIAGTVVGLLQASGCAGLNLVNAEVKTELTAGNEVSLVADSITVTGYPSPAGTVISGIYGAKVPVPVLAVGNLAVTKHSTAPLDEKLAAKVSVEYGLIGGGRLALFGELEPDDMEHLSKAMYSIVQFNKTA
ncbi:d-isomer specific 2-hydroxyacid dehydrogenase, NAD binding domain-containing protein [Ditylenchus destructor]|uniref:D-3-phosphoglycerate dehydrogenase n=1 Tax=Ditylenchus destructor TaxID=166010 RepID=A0AAD4NKX6_9BILA|nr:d-isomer specific 2-hydroxyacid dehydrogenase, NAD binding domain-containing protein [Ditylenchus destructor]